MDYIDALEKSLGKKAKINFLPLQPGDVRHICKYGKFRERI